MIKEQPTRKYYSFDDGVYDDVNERGERPVTGLINFINNNPGDLTIGMSSAGGEQGLSRYVVEVLNDNKDRIKLFVHTVAHSAMFEILWLFDGEVEIALGTAGMIHYGQITVGVNDRKKVAHSSEKFYVKNAKHQRKWRESMAKQVLTKKEYKKFKKGKDIYLDYNRMKGIFE